MRRLLNSVGRKSDDQGDDPDDQDEEFISDLDHQFAGQMLLYKPNIQKNKRILSNDRFTACMAWMQGWRVTMEDYSTMYLNIPNDTTNTSLFGVFDGHGGILVAEYVSKNLHKYLLKQSEFKDNLSVAITKAFVELDQQVRVNFMDDQSGSTAIIVLLRNNTLYCGNIGDSRAIAYENGRITPLSFDHKPTLPDEYKRILNAGGWVENGRVNGSLALSRAFGDFYFKSASNFGPEKQMVTCVPDIVKKEVDKHWKFIVLACDGIWEVMSNENVGEFVKNRLASGMNLDKICENLMDTCLATRSEINCVGCDNMTLNIILFKWPTITQ